MKICAFPIATVIFFAAALRPLYGLAGDAWSVKTDPSELVNGSPVLFRVIPPLPLASLRGVWFERELAFRFSPDCDCWYALAGVGLNQQPGKYPLRLEATGQNGAQAAFLQDVSVKEKVYPTTALSVPPKYIRPSKAALARIEREEALKKQLFSRISPETYWSGSFSPPVETTVSAVFGSARTFNGVKKTQHQGLDFHALIGTTVKASNRGVVLLARNLYGEGNCVVLDHGNGLLTLYMHLSEINVKEGATLENGKVLGKSGATGRVNGPHLHFAARWQGLYVDPETLLKLDVP